MIAFLNRIFGHSPKGASTPVHLTMEPAGDQVDPLFVFDHIPKTAGTTFRRSYLVAAFPREQRWILSGGSNNAEDIQRFIDLPEERRHRVRIVAGHQADTLREHVPAARFLTLVRDPVDRIVSSYLHALLHEGGDELWPDVREQQMGLREFVLKYEVPNMQSAKLLGPGTFTEGEMKRRLRSRYALVGYTEAFDQFMFMLHVREQFPLCLYHNRLVRGDDYPSRPSAADRAFVRELNAQDVLLHRVVRTEFNRQVNQLPLTARVRMTAYLEALERFRSDTAGDPAEPVPLEFGIDIGECRFTRTDSQPTSEP